MTLQGAVFAPDGAVEADRSAIADRYGQLPLAFERNGGQSDGSVDFLARAPGHTAFLGPTGATLALAGADREAGGVALRLALTGANPTARPVGQGRLPGAVNVMRGDDPRHWVADAPTFARVRYEEVWPGVDLAWHGTQEGRLEFDFQVRPGADPGEIGLRVEGARRLSLTDSGALRIETAAGSVYQHPPFAYQEVAGARQRVEASYRLDGRRVQLALGPYDRERPLTIDPVLAYSTFLGGSLNEQGLGIAVDASGSAYVTGVTLSTEFPTTVGAYDTSHNSGPFDLFVTKLDPSGSSLEYSTYLGGSSQDAGNGIALDTSGSAYLAVQTESSDFPTTAGALDTSFSGPSETAIAKLSPSGSGLEYSTYLGGSGVDAIFAIATAGGSAYVTGYTQAADFPTVAGSYDTTYNGAGDAFVAKLNPLGTGLLYSTFLGGSTEFETGTAIAVVGEDAYLTGYTSSSDFPTTAGAFDPTHNGGQDGFAAKLDAAGSGLDYSTYLGGASPDSGQAIAVDASGSAYLTGTTASPDFPTAAGSYDTTHNGGADAFAAKLSPSGAGLVYSTYLGGASTDNGSGIAIDPSGSAYVGGTTESAGFPTTAAALDTTYNGAGDAFVAKLDPLGAGLDYSTFFGESSQDILYGLAADASGGVYFTGTTASPGYPTTAAAFDPTYNGAGGVSGGIGDAFVSKLTIDVTPPEIVLTAPADGGSYLLGSTVLADYSCADEPGGSGLASCLGDVADGAAIDTTSVGAREFTVEAADAAGNTASLTHAYDVVYDFAGFFPPVDNDGVFNIVKAGRAIPVKFSLGGDQGLTVFASGFPRSHEIDCASAADVDGVESTLTAGSSSLSYDPVADRYTYVWKTKKAWAGSCRQLTVGFEDGTVHRANFKFK